MPSIHRPRPPWNEPSGLGIAIGAALLLNVALTCMVGRYIWDSVSIASALKLIPEFTIVLLLAFVSFGVSVAACGTAWAQKSRRWTTSVLLPVAPLMLAAAIALPEPADQLLVNVHRDSFEQFANTALENGSPERCATTHAPRRLGPLDLDDVSTTTGFVVPWDSADRVPGVVFWPNAGPGFAYVPAIPEGTAGWSGHTEPGAPSVMAYFPCPQQPIRSWGTPRYRLHPRGNGWFVVTEWTPAHY